MLLTPETPMRPLLGRRAYPLCWPVTQMWFIVQESSTRGAVPTLMIRSNGENTGGDILSGGAIMSLKPKLVMLNVHYEGFSVIYKEYSNSRDLCC